MPCLFFLVCKWMITVARTHIYTQLEECRCAGMNVCGHMRSHTPSQLSVMYVTYNIALTAKTTYSVITGKSGNDR